MLRYRYAPRVLLGTLVVIVAGWAGQAKASCGAVLSGTACVSKPLPDACYPLKGSDTWFDIMTESIRQARLAGVPGATDLCYFGTGSGNGESQMKKATSTALGTQSIAPMSRNFRPSIIDGPQPAFCDAGSPDFSQRRADDPTTTTVDETTLAGHDVNHSWRPTAANVGGLDAAVVLSGFSTPLGNIDFPTFVDSNPLIHQTADCASGTIPKYSPTRKAVANNSALPTDINDGTAFNNLSSTVNYSNLMSIVLSGADGSGTISACSDPRRVRAIQDLSAALGLTGSIQHILRRDDNSGTTDTFKDRIMVVSNTGSLAVRYPWTGGRFCNGTAVGGIDGTTLQQGHCSVTSSVLCTTDNDCQPPNTPSAEVCRFNLNNQDFDPVRRPCMAAGANAAPTSCTDMTTGRPCQASDGNLNCTQGLVVSISDTDPGATDITTSIGHRVGGSAGLVMGYAGREAASASFGSKSLKINTIASADARVRDSTYLLARRLFLQNGFINSTDSWDIPTDTATNGGITGGGADQRTKEQALYSWITNRANLDPIIRQFNFIRCSSVDDGADPCSETNNLCCLTPAVPTASAFGALPPSGAFGGTNGTGGARSISSAGRVWDGTALVAATCSGTAVCISGGTCDASGHCPDALARSAFSACSVNADCLSNNCRDVFGQATAGERHDLYCAP